MNMKWYSVVRSGRNFRKKVYCSWKDTIYECICTSMYLRLIVMLILTSFFMRKHSTFINIKSLLSLVDRYNFFSKKKFGGKWFLHVDFLLSLFPVLMYIKILQTKDRNEAPFVWRYVWSMVEWQIDFW